MNLNRAEATVYCTQITGTCFPQTKGCRKCYRSQTVPVIAVFRYWLTYENAREPDYQNSVKQTLELAIAKISSSTCPYPGLVKKTVAVNISLWKKLSAYYFLARILEPGFNSCGTVKQGDYTNELHFYRPITPS